MNEIYACGFMFNGTRDEVLLVLKDKPNWQKGKLNGIGGKVELEKGETPREAMVREFKEETGINTKNEDWELKVILDGHNWRVCFYACENFACRNLKMLLTDEQLLREIEPIYPVSLDILPFIKKIDNLKWLIPLCLSKTEDFPIYVHDKGN